MGGGGTGGFGDKGEIVRNLSLTREIIWVRKTINGKLLFNSFLPLILFSFYFKPKCSKYELGEFLATILRLNYFSI